jgi:hypothetical protein
MMSGAVWVRDRLQAAGWRVAVADARKVKAVAPLACKTDKVDARVLAELCRRDLVPALSVPSFSDRELRERLNRRAHLIRLRTAAKNRVFGALSQWGLRIPLRVLRKGDPMVVLEQCGVPAVWRRSVAEALAVIDILDARIAPLEAELRPLARADPRVQLLVTIPGVGEHLGLMIAAEIGDVARFPSPRNLIGFAGLAPRIAQSGQSSRTGALLQGRVAGAAVGGDRSSPVRVAADEPVEPAVPRRQASHRQEQPCQERRRTQSLDRRMARPRSRGAIQAQPPGGRHRSCPGKLPLSSGRLTAPDRIEKPGQLQPTRCAAKRRKRTEQSSTPGNEGRVDQLPIFKEMKIKAAARSGRCETRFCSAWPPCSPRTK